MGSRKRRWVWLAIVALLAVIWWLVPRPTSPSPTPAESKVEEPEPPTAGTSPSRPTSVERPGTEDQEPVAAPLPRHEVELPPASVPSDGGVIDPASVERRRDEMLGTVLDRLHEELRAAEESGSEEEAKRLKIRIERLSQRRDELTEP